ncbi:anti-sigma factor [Aureimonas phyllosphaerae]|uniref:Regulator of SigK n=1 Tax=Aureimonas phyllosphaerae TaxID=1166078 RepID=A0A7W6BW08_9HYPH|nr:anti-sigma factor [Aureimonas phyllosphaerae]MBB3937119.1 anti-sigma-K factor RskA [Aureimonas phyllosphaerae]MBB3961244.1 anti-sigma-K factor RskA [Aureimonas phyllosphaerae]SFF52100.1 Anti-sigma-K factor RskA [Aureimonas phyllosphaerae]
MSAGNERDGGDEALAGEYALGLLAPAERRAFERRLRIDPALSRETGLWEERLQPLLGETPAVSPPARLWQAIEAELGPAATRRDVRDASPGRAPSAQALRSPRSGGRRVSAVWQWLAIGSMALAAASLAGLALDLRPAAAPMMASIAANGGAPLFVAVVDPDGGHATLMPVSLQAQEGRVPELWLVPAGGTPISLGLVDPSAPLRVDLRARTGVGMGMMRTPGAALAVSMEPEGGSPTGQPTGPVVGHGMLRAV